LRKTILAGLGMLVVAAAAHAGGGKMTGVRQQVQVDSRDGKVWVKLSAENGGAKPVYLPNAVYKSDRLFGRVFDIKNLDTGAEVDYIGPMVKRGPYTRADYLVLKPGARLSHAIDITGSYDFKPGKHNYQLAYAGSYVGDIAHLDAGSEAPVAPVTFTHTGK
jgi:hypothetical protein